MHFREKAAIFLATGCFVGNIPFAPGTFGSLLGIPLCFVLSKINFLFASLCIIGFIVFAIWTAQRAEKILQKSDPGNIVIDEIAGMTVALIGLPFNLRSVVIGFIIFRAFDIFKPYPIRRMERRLSGGVGVVLDDVVAGLYSNLVLRLVLRFLDII
jgi:phosphatidylglycerophosphatase A